jgi:hypothetical protein
VLPAAVSSQGFEPICRRCAQVAEVAGIVEHVELSESLFFDAAELLHERAHPQALGRTVAKRPDHAGSIERGR